MIDNSPNIDRLIMIVQAAAGETVPDMGHPRTREEVFCSRALGLSWWPAITPLTGIEYCAAVAAGDIARGNYAPKTPAESYLLRMGDPTFLPIFSPVTRYDYALAGLAGAVELSNGSTKLQPATRWEPAMAALMPTKSLYSNIVLFSRPKDVAQYSAGQMRADYLGNGSWHVYGRLTEAFKIYFAPVDVQVRTARLEFRNYGGIGVNWRINITESNYLGRAPSTNNYSASWTVSGRVQYYCTFLPPASGATDADFYFQLCGTNPNTSALSLALADTSEPSAPTTEEAEA